MCSKPKMPKRDNTPNPVVLTRADTEGTGRAAARKRKAQVRLDLNNATTPYQGLTIPNG